MHRYFFHTDDGRAFHDDEGTVLENDAAARVEASRVLAQLVGEQPDAVWRDDLFRVTVTDERGTALFVLDLAAMNAPAAAPFRP